MNILISSIGTRGEVQPILALALELRALGHQPSLCVAPDFKEWVESFGIPCTPLGPNLKQYINRRSSGESKEPNRAQWKEMLSGVVAEQFTTTAEAARDCDLIVVAGALQTAGRSIAEVCKIPYVYAGYCPATFPSPDHPPPERSSEASAGHSARWETYLARWNDLFRDAINEQRQAFQLEPIAKAPQYVMTDRPWLAADPVLAPCPRTTDMTVSQCGAWLLRDGRPLPEPVERFLADGDPPIYMGIGSMGAAPGTGRTLIDAARSIGRRVILSQGWAELRPIDDNADCLGVGDINHESLLSKVAAIVHHGGAGTTMAATLAGKPQIVIPHMYDQFYWAQRVTQLKVGAALASADQLSVERLASALREALRSEATSAARDLAGWVEPNGARLTAERLHREFCGARTANVTNGNNL